MGGCEVMTTTFKGMPAVRYELPGMTDGVCLHAALYGLQSCLTSWIPLPKGVPPKVLRPDGGMSPEVKLECKVIEWHRKCLHVSNDALMSTVGKLGIIFPYTGVKKVSSSCPMCQRLKGNAGKVSKRPPVRGFNPHMVRFNFKVTVDLKPLGKSGWHLVVMQCDESRYIELRMVRTKAMHVVHRAVTDG